MNLLVSSTLLRSLVFVILLPLSNQPLFADQTTTKSTTPSVSVAVVNVRYLLQHAPQSEAASEELKKRFLSKEQELDKEAKAIRDFEESIRESEGRISHEEKIEKTRELRSRKRNQSRSLEDYQEDLRLAKSAALDDVQKAVFEAIDKVRSANDIDIIIQEYISASQRVDITQTVLALLAERLKKENTNKPTEKE